jgi:hypothetical protein
MGAQGTRAENYRLDQLLHCKDPDIFIYPQVRLPTVSFYSHCFYLSDSFYKVDKTVSNFLETKNFYPSYIFANKENFLWGTKLFFKNCMLFCPLYIFRNFEAKFKYSNKHLLHSGPPRIVITLETGGDLFSVCFEIILGHSVIRRNRE